MLVASESRSAAGSASIVPRKRGATEFEGTLTSPKQHRGEEDPILVTSQDKSMNFANPQPTPSPMAKLYTPTPTGSDFKQSLGALTLFEAIRTLHWELQAGGRPYSDTDATLYSRRLNRPAMYIPSSPDKQIRLARTLQNHDNKFVRIFTQYECQKSLARNSDMRDLTAVAYSCTELCAGFNLDSAEWCQIWANMVQSIRRSDMPFVPEAMTPVDRHTGSDSGGEGQGEDEDDGEDEEEEEGEGDDSSDDDSEEQPRANRIMASHWKFSVTD